MYVDEFGRYPMTGGMAVLGVRDDYGWLTMDDGKETLAPYLDVKVEGEFLNPLSLRKLRGLQLVQSGSIRANGKYACNASGTAKLWDLSHLGLGGYGPMPIRHNTESQVQAPAEMIADGDVDVKPD